ncbi:MAG: hypothetical protein U0132_02500 [Gemmatimonadaceae bacterium]
MVAVLATANARLWAQDTVQVAAPPNAKRTANELNHNDAPDSAAFTLVLANRQFLIPDRVVAGLKIQPSIGIRWQTSRWLALRADLQSVDNSGPGRQGAYLAQRALGDGVGSGNFLQELTIGAEARRSAPLRFGGSLWASAALSHARRSYSIVNPANGAVVERSNKSEVVPSASLRWVGRARRVRVGGGLEWAGFPQGNAMYLRRLPDDSLTFGHVVAVALTPEWQLWPSLSLAGHAALPMTGHNSIARETGRLARVPIYEVSARWNKSQALSARLFATNALGSAGALALVADREYVAIGGGVEAHMGLGARAATSGVDTLTSSSAVGAWLPGTAVWSLTAQAGSAGTSTVASVTLVPGLGISLFGDLVTGTRDESEIGGALTVTLWDVGQAQRKRTTVALLTAASHTDNVFVNFLQGDPGAFQRIGDPKRPIRFGTEDDSTGELYLLTGGVVVSHTYTQGASWAVTPLITTAQRKGRQLAGVVVSGSAPVFPTLEMRADVGTTLSSRGNTLSRDGRRNVLAWEGSSAWRVWPWLRVNTAVGNRLGLSPFHQLRVRALDRVGMRIGATISR